MCRNIRPLFNYNPPSTKEDVYAASLQFVRKVSGYSKPSQVNEEAFHQAVEQVANTIDDLFARLETNAPPRDREKEIQKARERNKQRFA